jgi:hypothetical protein
MARWIVLNQFSSVDGYSAAAGDIIDDTSWPLATLLPQGLAVLAYSPTAAAVAQAFQERLNAAPGDESQSLNQQGLAESLIMAGLIVTMVALSGAGDPNGVTAGMFGQLYRRTTNGQWYVCTSSPVGTAWAMLTRTITGAGNPNAGGGTAGAIGTAYVDTVGVAAYMNLDGTATGWHVIS